MRRWGIATGLVLVLAATGLGAVKARLQAEPGVQQVVSRLPVRSMRDIARSP
jgi:hypothetical protein